MWPEIEVKSRPNFPRVAQKVATAASPWKVMFSKNTRHLGCFWKKSVTKNFQKLPNLVTLFTNLLFCECFPNLFKNILSLKPSPPISAGHLTQVSLNFFFILPIFFLYFNTLLRTHAPFDETVMVDFCFVFGWKLLMV